MLVDMNSINALGAACSSHADDLAAAAAGLTSSVGPDVAAAFGAVGAGFLAALSDATTAHAQAVIRLSEDLQSAQLVSGGVAAMYADADRRSSRAL
ncbi:ESX-1 secretion-associated protein [Mycolicibacterium agri]|nr:ESX-1 secretion-associated protein [Mycolicibacterium agri]